MARKNDRGRKEASKTSLWYLLQELVVERTARTSPVCCLL
jgi:hypothetical protein